MVKSHTSDENHPRLCCSYAAGLYHASRRTRPRTAIPLGGKEHVVMLIKVVPDPCRRLVTCDTDQSPQASRNRELQQS